MRPRPAVLKTDYPMRIVILSKRSEPKDLSSSAARRPAPWLPPSSLFPSMRASFLRYLPFPPSRDEKPVTATPLDSALTNGDARKSFRIRSYANCRVSPALSSQNLILDPVSCTSVPRIGRSPVRGFFSPQFTFNFELSTVDPCANSFRINTCEPLVTVDSKRLTQMLSPLDATFTKNRGEVLRRLSALPRKLPWCPLIPFTQSHEGSARRKRRQAAALQTKMPG